MFPRSVHRTGIRVDFHMPWAPAGTEAAVGEFYTKLYVRLWDQDEAMMRERQRVLDAVATNGHAADGRTETSVSLGRVHELASRLPLEVELGGRRFRVVSVDGQIFAHDTRCPHLGGPLAGHAVEGCEAVCPWHGYRFDVRTGLSSDGRTLRLARSAVVEIDACSGDVRLRLP
jgi:nitrite reductase/ring-hydroxylating ferredoxin subunit